MYHDTTELIVLQINLCTQEGSDMVLQAAAVASTCATLTKSKYLCQRGADRDSFRNVLNALSPNLIATEIDACQRGADGNGLRNVLGGIWTNAILLEVDDHQRGVDMHGQCNGFDPLTSVSTAAMYVYPAQLVVCQINLCTKEVGKKISKLATLASTDTTFTCAEIKHLCQRGGSNGPCDVHSTIMPKVVAPQIDAGQRVVLKQLA